MFEEVQIAVISSPPAQSMDETLKRYVEFERRLRQEGAPPASSRPGAVAVTEGWRASVGSAEEYMSLFDLDLRITFMNRLQPGIPDVVGLSVLSCIEPSKHEVFLQSTAAAYITGLPHYYETRGTGPAGRAVAYRSWVVPLSGRDQAAVFASVSVDITHLDRVQRELEEQTSVLDTLVRNAPDSIAVLDRGLRVLFVNHVLEGFTLSQVLGAELPTFFPEPHRGRVRSNLEHVFRSGEGASFEVPLEEKLALLTEASAAMQKNTQVLFATAQVSFSHDWKFLVTSEGSFIEQSLYYSSCGC